MMKRKYLIVALLFMFLVETAYSQNVASPRKKEMSTQVIGKVTELNGEPIPGAIVKVKGTLVSTTTNAEGQYKIRVPNQRAILQFSYVGFEMQEILVEGKIKVDVVLKESNKSLNEVVVIGYGTVDRRDLTGAVVSINSEDIEKRAPISIAEALQGSVSGVQIATGSGQPGEGASIVIRGRSTFNDDGIGPLYIIDGVQQTDADAINPNDIASIEVLKDAASSAIYGSRSANGVIIITTKKGSKNKPDIQLNFLQSFNQLAHTLPQLNSAQYRELQKRQLDYTKGEGSGIVSQAVINAVTAQMRDSTNFLFSFDHDYQDDLFNIASKSQIDLGFGGGSDNLKYRLATGYLKEKGIIEATSFNRLTARLNADYTPSKQINFASRIYFAYRNKEGTDEAGFLNSLLGRRPNSSYYYPDGTLIGLFYGVNPKALTELTNFTDSYDATFFQSGDINLSRDLKFTTTFNANIGLSKFISQRPSFISADGLSNTGTERNILNWNWSGESYLNYTKSFQKAHNIKALLGVSAQSWKRESEFYSGKGAPTDEIYTQNAFRANYNLNATYTDQSIHRLASAFSRLSYDYKSKYIVNATLRVDGSSRFSRANQYGYFPSVSAAWRFSDESFMKWATQKNLFHDGKIRLSYGVTGNESIGDFENILSYSIGGVYDGLSGIAAARIASSNLTWEETRQTNLGLDLSFVKNRYQLTVDFYNKQTSNLLANFQIPTEWGFSSLRSNIGSINNKGIEIDLRGDIVRSKKLTWNVGLNISKNDNRIKTIAGGAPYIYDANWYISEGGRIGDWFGYQQLNIFPYNESNAFSDSWQQLTPVFKKDQGGQMVKDAAGKFILENYLLNNSVYTGQINQKKLTDGSVFRGGDVNWYDNEADVEGRGVINDKDRKILGNAQPDFTGGFNTTLNYKNFSFFIATYFSIGGEIYNQAKFSLNNTAMDFFSTMPSVEFSNNFWLNQGDETIYPRPYADSYQNDRTLNGFYLEDASYLKVRNVRLSYSMPAAFSKKMHIKRLSIYGYVNNALTFTNYSGYDPEFSDGTALGIGQDTNRYPRKREFGVGLNMNF